MKRNKIILIVGVLSLFLIVIGITYAYFSANIFNNENTSTINYEAGSLAIELDGGNNIVANAIIPGDSPWATKTFTVIGNNDSNGYMPYSVSLVVDENTYSDNAISYTLEGSNTSNNGSIIENRENTEVNYTDIIGSGYFTPGKNLKHTYTLKLYFLETNTDQSEDMRSTFKCHIEINGGRASKNKIRVTFDADGGELATLSKEVVINGAYGNLPTPTKEGYEFLGWNGKNILNLDKYAINQKLIKITKDSITIFKTDTDYGYASEYINLNNNEYYSISASKYGEFTNRAYAFFGVSLWSELFNNNKYQRTFRYNSNEDKGRLAVFQNHYHDRGDLILQTDKLVFYNILLTEGTEATEYEPYYIDQYTKVVQYEDHTLKAIWKEL